MGETLQLAAGEVKKSLKVGLIGYLLVLWVGRILPTNLFNKMMQARVYCKCFIPGKRVEKGLLFLEVSDLHLGLCNDRQVLLLKDRLTSV